MSRVLVSVFTAVVMSLSLMLLSTPVIADSPDTIKAPDRHSIEVTGKVNLFRVQTEGMELGKGSDKVDAEVFVTLDSKPDMVYALQLHGDSPDANKVMADTLRAAYINKLPVKLYYQLNLKQKNNYKILMVQLN